MIKIPFEKFMGLLLVIFCVACFSTGRTYAKNTERIVIAPFNLYGAVNEVKLPDGYKYILCKKPEKSAEPSYYFMRQNLKSHKIDIILNGPFKEYFLSDSINNIFYTDGQNIFTMNRDGSGSKKLTNKSVQDMSFKLYFNGSIYYTKGTDEFTIYKFNVNTLNTQQLYHTNSYVPLDGDHLMNDDCIYYPDKDNKFIKINILSGKIDEAFSLKKGRTFSYYVNIFDKDNGVIVNTSQGTVYGAVYNYVSAYDINTKKLTDYIKEAGGNHSKPSVQYCYPYMAHIDGLSIKLINLISKEEKSFSISSKDAGVTVCKSAIYYFEGNNIYSISLKDYKLRLLYTYKPVKKNYGGYSKITGIDMKQEQPLLSAIQNVFETDDNLIYIITSEDYDPRGNSFAEYSFNIKTKEFKYVGGGY